jgi:iron complex outermembrane receptor protein
MASLFKIFSLKITFSILLAFFTVLHAGAQNCSFTLGGHVEDADTKEKLKEASISIKETGQQIATDDEGNFLFTGLCAGKYTVIISHVGCDMVEKIINLQKNAHFDVYLLHSRNELGNVIVEAKRGVANTGYKKELSGKALAETQGLNLAEALNRINGVTMLQSGPTVSKPVIHGLHGSRILTINNGVRQEGQQWGNDHAPEIDPFIAEKLIVIKGVDELRYGSDAIGGVILVEPRAIRNTPGYAAELNAGYFTNNRQYVVSGLFEQQLKNKPFHYRVQGTYKKGANVTTPDYRLNNTGNQEQSFSLTGGWSKEKFHSEIFLSHFATKLGIFPGSHIGNITDLQNAIAAPKPDDVFLGQNTYNIIRPYQDVTHDLLKSKSIFYKGDQKFTVLLSGQYNRRKEYDIVRSSNNQRPQLDLTIYTFTEDFTWEKMKKNNFNGVAGISMMQQDNSYSGRYFIPNYFAYSFGAYYLEKWAKHKWELQAGIRYDNKTINTTRLKFNSDTINYDFNFSTLASSFNAIYKLNAGWRLNTNISLASRAPYVNELLSDGIHHGTATYEKGDITLVPEKSFNVSTGINYQNPAKTFSFEALFYNNNIRDFIYQQPIPNDPVLTISGAFPLIEYQQTDALLNGFDVSAYVKLLSTLEWRSKFAFLNARNKQTDDWLIWMPANRLTNEITFSPKDTKKFTGTYFSAEMQNVMEQKNVPDESNGKQDYKAPPPAYALVNLNASTQVTLYKVPTTFSIGVRNLLNTNYRDYLNSMRYFADEMGLNINFRVKFQF